MIRKNKKLIIGLMIGIIVSSVGVYAANSLNAGSITIDKTEGKLAKITGEKLNNALDYLYDKANTTNMITIESGVLHETQTYLGIVYLDPTNLNNKCTAANSVSTTGTKTGCMKWYIYKEYYNDEDGKWYYKMILDHNTTAQQAWNTTGNNGLGTNVEFKANNGNLAYDELMKLVNESGWKVTPGLIGADEVADIVGYSGFTPTNSTWFCLDSKEPDEMNLCSKSQGTSNFTWMLDNLGWNDQIGKCINYGCNYSDTESSGGYWTKTTYDKAESGTDIWYIGRVGYLNKSYAASPGYGLRPVITIPKS